MNRIFSSTAARLGAAFAVIISLFATMLGLTLSTLGELEIAEQKLGKLDHAKHAGHAAANLVRELYIHQAHTLIAWDLSHIAHYNEVLGQTTSATEHLNTLRLTGANLRRAEQIAQLAREMDEVFQRAVVPAVRAPTRNSLTELHAEIESRVHEVTSLNESLNRDLETESEQARKHAQTRRKAARSMIVLCCGLAIGIAVVVGIALVRSILRPIKVLKAGAIRVASGDLDARIDLPGVDEFAQLATTFNQMVVDVRRHQTQLLHAHRLASIGQVAAGVAHEINNPLGVILGYAKLLKRGAPQNIKEEIQIIEDEAAQCQQIVRELLDLARVTELGIENVDLCSLAHDCVQTLKHSTAFSQRAITMPPCSPCTVQGDRARLRQVLVNLLTNAIEASQDAEVRIEVGTQGDEGFLSVRDSGPGIKPELLERVTDPFYTTKAHGTGLGLAICQNIVDAHGGRVEITSSKTGTVATVWLPLSLATKEA